MRRTAAGLVLLVAVLCGCSGSRSRAAPAPVVAATSTTASTTRPATGTAACSRPHAPGQTTETITSGGIERTYELVVPSSFRADQLVPVVFEFHGYGSNATQQLLYGNFRPESERDGFLIVAPDGGGTGGRHFNLLSLPGEPDDVALTLAILDRLEATFCVDAARVFATGMSDGGGMTTVLACRASDRIAAFGAVSLELHLPNCGATRPVPIAAFHGTADPIVPYAGGPVHCCGGASVPSVAQSMSGWATQDRCSATPTDTQLSPMVIRREWSDCAPGGQVELYVIDGGGHTWPGSSFAIGSLGRTTTEISASEVLWKFFQAHPLPVKAGA